MMIKRIGLFLLIVIFLLGCGKKGPLKLEPQLMPKEIENLQIFQVGDTIKLQWDFPQTLAGKKKTQLEPEKIGKIYIYYSNKEILGGKFKKKSTLLKKPGLEDLTEAPFSSSKSSTSSGKTALKNFSYFLAIPFKLKELDNKDHFFGIQYYYQKKKSPMSQIAFIHTMVPVKPVADLKIDQENKVIKLRWSKPLQDEAGNPITTITGYNIYRKIEPEEAGEAETGTTGESTAAGTGVFGKINQKNVLVEYYEDMDTGINGNYSYYVSAVISNQIETAPSPLVSIRITDIFPPEVPANLVCFKAQDHLFLTWRPVMDTDLSHYRVYRRLPDGEFRLIADDIAATSYKDKELKEGKTYYYVVTAVDKKGNESQYSNEVKEQF